MTASHTAAFEAGALVAVVSERTRNALAEGALVAANVRDVAAPCLEALLTMKLVA